MEYDKLLDRAYEKLSTMKKDEERFRVPEVDVISQGRKTFIKNLGIVAKSLKRDTNHMMKYFIKETGLPATYDGQKLILNGNINTYKIVQMYRKYVDDYVFCKQCKKPETKLLSERGVSVIKCEACGAINPVRRL